LQKISFEKVDVLQKNCSTLLNCSLSAPIVKIWKYLTPKVFVRITQMCIGMKHIVEIFFAKTQVLLMQLS